MKTYLTKQHCLEVVAGLIALIFFLIVLESFVIGKHYIMPTIYLVVTIIFGNLAYYGFKGYVWAKSILFWLFFLFSAHVFFAIFYTQRYREILGGAWEPVGSLLFIILAFGLYVYASSNALFKDKSD